MGQKLNIKGQKLNIKSYTIFHGFTDTSTKYLKNM